jgi:hypothetical protein
MMLDDFNSIHGNILHMYLRFYHRSESISFYYILVTLRKKWYWDPRKWILVLLGNKILETDLFFLYLKSDFMMNSYNKVRN